MSGSVQRPPDEKPPMHDGLRIDMLDFPTAWAIQERGVEHRSGCSSDPRSGPMCGPHFLCDCGAVEGYWKLLVKEAEVSR